MKRQKLFRITLVSLLALSILRFSGQTSSAYTSDRGARPAETGAVSVPGWQDKVDGGVLAAA